MRIVDALVREIAVSGVLDEGVTRQRVASLSAFVRAKCSPLERGGATPAELRTAAGLCQRVCSMTTAPGSWRIAFNDDGCVFVALTHELVWVREVLDPVMTASAFAQRATGPVMRRGQLSIAPHQDGVEIEAGGAQWLCPTFVCDEVVAYLRAAIGA